MNNKFEVKLKSEMYNHDNEHIIKKEVIKENKYDTNKLLIIGIISFFLLLLILIIIVILSR